MNLIRCLCCGILFLLAHRVFAIDFQIEKQKLKLSLEYENYIDPEGNEVFTSGASTSYWLKGKLKLPHSSFLSIDLQSGLKGNFVRQFQSGELPAAIWSNRISTTLTVPIQKFYVGSSLFVWDKYLLGISDTDPFIDVFGGLGFRETTGSLQAGFVPSSDWDVSVSAQASNLNFRDFPFSDSSWKGGSLRIHHKIEKARVFVSYRYRDIDFQRPALVAPGPFPVVFPIESIFIEKQQDQFQEWGAGIEFFPGFYLQGGYYFQRNQSNNPGFDYDNHRFQFLIGTEIAPSWHFQAFGTVQQFDFPVTDEFLQIPLLLDENDYNTMAASLTKTLKNSHELELGVQRLANRSSFEQLDVSKFLMFASYNYRW